MVAIQLGVFTLRRPMMWMVNRTDLGKTAAVEESSRRASRFGVLAPTAVDSSSRAIATAED
jgi:hypothetical protein